VFQGTSLPGSPRRWPAYCARRCHLDRPPRALQAAAPLLIPTGPRIGVSQALAALLQACRRWRPIQRNGRKDRQKLHVEIVKTRTRRRIAKKTVLQRLSGCLGWSFVVRPCRAQVPDTSVVAGLFRRAAICSDIPRLWLEVLRVSLSNSPGNQSTFCYEIFAQK
jgi:hypothetical protein